MLVDRVVGVEGTPVDVVILRRHPVKVVRSFAELGYFTPRNPAWVGWMPDPVSTDPSLATLFPEADQLDRIMGYLASFEYTIDRLRATRPDVRFYELCLEDLATPDGASALVGALGLEWDPTLVRHIRKIRNARSDRKSYFDMDIPEQVCENRLASFYERLTRQGRDLPDLRERWERARETTAVKPDRGQG